MAGLGVSLLVRFGAFLVVANEWFMMWRSSERNARETAFSLTLPALPVLVFPAVPDGRDGP